MRLILIDNYTGNFDIRACLTEAARMIDADNGTDGRTYTVHSRAPRDGYRADVRDPEIIERDCEFMGFVEAKK